MLMLDYKGVPFDTLELPIGWHWPLMRLRRFPGKTVPGLVLEGRRIQTIPEISRFLEHVRPRPPLFPPGEGRRREVEQVEEWGHTVLQMAARRLVLAAGRRGLDELI